MPANEASGIGGWSYGRIALYLQEVDRTLIHQQSRALFLFPKQGFQAVLSATVHVKHVRVQACE